jgi:hypothetical protein
MRKGNSISEPKRLEKLRKKYQVRWGLKKVEHTDEDGNPDESWDYYYANCRGNSYGDIVEGIIRSRYDAGNVEAILANYSQKKDVIEYLKFQAWRDYAKQVAAGHDVTGSELIQMKMPLSFVLTGGKYEVLADRVLKLNCPYEISVEEGVEMVTTWLVYIEEEHESITDDEEVEVQTINLLDETI